MEKSTMTNFTGKVFNDPTRLHEAVLLVDCTDGNPNGDPSMGNQPRTDLEMLVLNEKLEIIFISEGKILTRKFIISLSKKALF